MLVTERWDLDGGIWGMRGEAIPIEQRLESVHSMFEYYSNLEH